MGVAAKPAKKPKKVVVETKPSVAQATQTAVEMTAQATQTAKVRVLCIFTDGRQQQEVSLDNDLGLKPQSDTYKDDIIARLKNMGVTGIKEVKLPDVENADSGGGGGGGGGK